MSRPAVVAGGLEPESVLRPVAVILLILIVLRIPALLVMFLMPLLVLLALGWLLGRIGLLGPLTLLRWRRRQPPTPSQALAFRWDNGGRITCVRLAGYDTGIELGDQVAVTGVRKAGLLHATTVHNHTTAVVMRRRGLAGLVVLALLNTCLLLSLLATVGGT